MPAFGDLITTKVKKTPHGSFAPRGVDRVFLGCLDNVTAGVLTGDWDGFGWHFDVSSACILHATIEVNGSTDQEEQHACDLGAGGLAPSPPMGAGTQSRGQIVRRWALRAQARWRQSEARGQG